MSTKPTETLTAIFTFIIIFLFGLIVGGVWFGFQEYSRYYDFLQRAIKSNSGCMMEGNFYFWTEIKDQKDQRDKLLNNRTAAKFFVP